MKSYSGHQGGIFTHKTRERILTKKGISGRGRKKDQFWYRQRENVKTSLLDLHLFIEKAGVDNVNQVVTAESLRPIANALFLHPRLDQAEPDLVRAEIARLFIQEGFNYLGAMQREYMTKIHERSIEEAIDLSYYLTLHIENLLIRRPK